MIFILTTLGIIILFWIIYSSYSSLRNTKNYKTTQILEIDSYIEFFKFTNLHNRCFNIENKQECIDRLNSDVILYKLELNKLSLEEWESKKIEIYKENNEYIFLEENEAFLIYIMRLRKIINDKIKDETKESNSISRKR